jgi:hypothetical protein
VTAKRIAAMLAATFFVAAYYVPWLVIVTVCTLLLAGTLYGVVKAKHSVERDAYKRYARRVARD